MSTGYVRHFEICNRHHLARFKPFLITGQRYGWISNELVPHLRDMEMFREQADGISLIPSLTGFGARSDALAQATQWISAHYNKPLRGEMYAVVENWQDKPLAQIDRAAVPWFRVRAWGVHVNGFVRKSDGLHLWVGERAANRPADPGKLDNLIGGGQPIGLTLEENMCKEAKEEAGIDASLALTAKRMRDINYQLERKDGMRSDTLFTYDLELPEKFTPHNTDGEVAAFHLMPLARVAELVRMTDKFKFNCNLVIIDFLMRYGFITPADAEYTALTHWLDPDSSVSTSTAIEVKQVAQR
jgi:8-oxo-dGTP pyrophosphatase MutT (NUDIX family)